MKRCKNCRGWRPFKGNEPTRPGRSSHACLMTNVVGQKADGTEVLIRSTSPKGEKTPHWGKRTDPNFVCDQFYAKPSPRLVAEKQ